MSLVALEGDRERDPVVRVDTVDLVGGEQREQRPEVGRDRDAVRVLRGEIAVLDPRDTADRERDRGCDDQRRSPGRRAATATRSASTGKAKLTYLGSSFSQVYDETV